MLLPGWPALVLGAAIFPGSSAPLVEERPEQHAPGRPPPQTKATFLGPLQSLVNRVSSYQDSVPLASAGQHGLRPYAPLGPADSVKTAMGTVGSAYAALQNTLSLPGTQAPKRPGEEEPVKEGFSAWEQPNWWNKPPEWLDSLPWWLEGYLESKAREGELAKDKG
jgi:hypothetical protein